MDVLLRLAVLNHPVSQSFTLLNTNTGKKLLKLNRLDTGFQRLPKSVLTSIVFLVYEGSFQLQMQAPEQT